MGSTQISFASFATPDDRGALGWRRAAAIVRDHSGVRDPADLSGRSFWRLHASNHRELARSVELYDSSLDARGHVAVIANNLSGLIRTTFSVTSARSTGWYVALDGVPVMMCARWYQSAAVAAQAGTRSLAALAASTHPAAGEIVRVEMPEPASLPVQS